MATRYVAVHENPAGPGDSRPTAMQIIEDEGLEGKWSDKVVFITGCSAGIGVESAKALFKTGATLYLTARDISKAKAALGDLAVSGRVNLLELDLNSYASVKACAENFLSLSQKLNILILNAGVMIPPEGRTKDGFETQIGTNHLSHFLLFNLLAPVLLASATPASSSRVVILSSSAHHISEVNVDNINFDGNYEPWQAYGASKTANIWMANEIERRYGSQSLHAWSVHPGAVITELGRHMPEEQKSAAATDAFLSKISKHATQGAATPIWAATAQALDGQGGKYLEDCQISGPWDPQAGIWSSGYAKYAYDEKKARLLWDRSLKWVGLQ